MLNIFMQSFVITEHSDSRQHYSKYTFATDNRTIAAFSITVVVKMQYCMIYFGKVQ